MDPCRMHAFAPRPGVRPGRDSRASALASLSIVAIAVALLPSCRVEGTTEPKPNGSRPVRVGIIDGPIDLELDAFSCLHVHQEPTAGGGDHGIAVAAIVLGVADGVCREWSGVEIYSFPVLDGSNAGASAVEIAQAIDSAVDADVDVLNMSIDLHAFDETLAQSVKAAHAAGVVMVASAGNRAGLGAGYPAALTAVVSVGALDAEGGLAPFSAAQGVDVAFLGHGVSSLTRH